MTSDGKDICAPQSGKLLMSHASVMPPDRGVKQYLMEPSRGRSAFPLGRKLYVEFPRKFK
jgi:hypothetical protein